jgi:hypothetical protein
MSQADVPIGFEPQIKESRILLTAAIVAAVLEFTLVVIFGVRQEWLNHRPKPALDPNQFIEAQMVQAPEEPHLRDEKKIAAPTPREAALSKRVDQGRKAKPDEKPLQDQNQTTGGPKLGPTHGPVAVFTPAPVIPGYLQNELLQASVVIDFFISQTPKSVCESTLKYNRISREKSGSASSLRQKRWGCF